MALAPRRGVFVDKDGTLVDDVPYNADPQLQRLAPGAIEALRMLSDAGYRLVVISNQSGIARGYFAEEDLRELEGHLRSLLAGAGIAIDGFYYCPHHPDGKVERYSSRCSCRKPAPGMILRASEDLGLDVARSWMVGDILDDIEAGRRAGCRTVLIDNGNETEWVSSALRTPHHSVADLGEAARVILERTAVGAEPVG